MKELSAKQKEVLEKNKIKSAKEAREKGRKGGIQNGLNAPKRKAKEELKKEIIQETYGQVYDRLKDGTLSNDELLKLFGSVVRISGDLVQKQEISNTTPLIVVDDEKHKEILEQIKNADLN